MPYDDVVRAFDHELLPPPAVEDPDATPQASEKDGDEVGGLFDDVEEENLEVYAEFPQET